MCNLDLPCCFPRPLYVILCGCYNLGLPCCFSKPLYFILYGCILHVDKSFNSILCRLAFCSHLMIPSLGAITRVNVESTIPCLGKTRWSLNPWFNFYIWFTRFQQGMIMYIKATWIHACDEKSVFDLMILNIWFVFSNSRTGCTFLWIDIVFTIMLLLWSCMYMETRHISIKLFFHWKQKIVNLTALSSLVAL